MTTLPAVRETNQLAVPSGTLGIEGLESLGPSDIILPRVTIVQLTSKGSDAYGQFRNNLSGEILPILQAVILRVSRSRTLWSGDLSDTKPECSSYDGVTSRDGQQCATCEFNHWEDNGLKRCSLGYTFLCVNPDSEEMFLLGAMGTSVRPAKILISQFAMKKRSPFSAVTEFRTERVENDKGKFYVLKPTIARWLDAAEVAIYRAQYLAMQGVVIHEVEVEAEAEGIEDDSLPF